MPSIYDWSPIAADNDDADTGITWAEGQAPSTANDSARTMMKRVADLLDDLGYGIVATGTANAIAVSTSAAFAALATGLMIGFKAQFTNTTATTLNANGIGAKKLIKFTAAGEADLAANDIIAGGRYFTHYDSTADAATGAWILHDGHTAMPRSGGTFTGQVITAAGSASAPAIGIGEADCGFYNIGSNNIGLALNGTKVLDFTTTVITFANTAGAAQIIAQSSTGSALFRAERYEASVNPPSFTGRKGRGTAASPSSVTNGDVLVSLIGQGYDGTANAAFGNLNIETFETTPGTSAHGSKFRVDLTTPGTASTSFALTVDATNGVQIAANTVITASRHVQHRSYTVATAPSPSPAGQETYFSDEVGGPTLAFSDASNWRRHADRAVIS